MYAATIENAIQRIPGLAENGTKVARAIHNAVLNGGDGVRHGVDILHGVWLGHPLHPVLTDIPIGAWTIGVLCDLVAAQSDSAEAAKMADALLAIGVVAAVPTAVVGVADYSAIQKPAIVLATAHGLLNTVGLVLNIASLRDRTTGNRGRGVLLSTVAFGVVNLAGWIGGEMVFRKHVGVDHHAEASGPNDWRVTLDAGDLPERAAKRVEIDGAPVLIYRDRTSIYAIGAVCSHAGGPLDEGSFEGVCVRCPWHDSVFDLRDGSVRHGPATYPEPAYDVRVERGSVEVRLRRATADA